MTKRLAAYFLSLLSLLKEDHLVGIKQIKILNLQSNRIKYAVAAVACAYARMLMDDPSLCSDFYAEAFPKGFRRLHRQKILLHVLMYLEDARDGGKYKVASARAVSLQSVCNDRNIPEEKIAEHIRACGGFNGLLDNADDDDLDEVTNEVSDDDPADEPTFTKGAAVPARPKRRSSVATDDDELTEEEVSVETDEAEPVVDSEEESSPSRPQRKEPAQPKLALLPRTYIAQNILARPSNAADRIAILTAIKNRRKVSVEFVPGEVSDTHELYASGGPFMAIVIGSYTIR